MTALLDILSEAAELRETAEAEFRKALVRASAQHSLRECARAANISHAGVAFILRTERGTK